MNKDTLSKAQTLLERIEVLKRVFDEDEGGYGYALVDDFKRAIDIIYDTEKEEAKAFFKKFLDKYQKEFDEL